MGNRTPAPVLQLLVLFTCSVLLLQVVAVKPIPHVKAESSRIIQDSIVQHVNSNPNAGWQAQANPRFVNYTIEQFKHILGVKPMPHFISLLRQISFRRLKMAESSSSGSISSGRSSNLELNNFLVL